MADAVGGDFLGNIIDKIGGVALYWRGEGVTWHKLFWLLLALVAISD
jgi:hypothetical protein